jgi:hypothetical protein
MPTVNEQNPTDQNSCRQDTRVICGKRWRISRLVFALPFPTIADPASFGGDHGHKGHVIRLDAGLLALDLRVRLVTVAPRGPETRFPVPPADPPSIFRDPHATETCYGRTVRRPSIMPGCRVQA